MRSRAIVTLTRFPDIFKRLAESVDRWEPETECIVVVDSKAENIDEVLLAHPRWKVVPGAPGGFIFARNANLGLAAAGEDTDVLLVNDDCEFLMPLTRPLQDMAYENLGLGIIAPSVVGDVGNPLQRAVTKPSHGWVESIERLAFVCVWLPATTRASVRLLDEGFTGYGGDDRDYCSRTQEKGLRLAVAPALRVRHGFGGNQSHSASFLRVMDSKTRERQMKQMDRIAEEKRQRRCASPS